MIIDRARVGFAQHLRETDGTEPLALTEDFEVVLLAAAEGERALRRAAGFGFQLEEIVVERLSALALSGEEMGDLWRKAVERRGRPCFAAGRGFVCGAKDVDEFEQPVVEAEVIGFHRAIEQRLQGSVRAGERGIHEQDRAFGMATGPTGALPKRLLTRRRANEDDTINAGNVHAEFQGGGRDDAAQLPGGECGFDLLAVGGFKAGTIGKDTADGIQFREIVRGLLPAAFTAAQGEGVEFR